MVMVAGEPRVYRDALQAVLALAGRLSAAELYWLRVDGLRKIAQRLGE